MKKKSPIILVLALLWVACAVAGAFACCDNRITVDPEEAARTAKRDGRAPLEGIWSVNVEWYPIRLSTGTYRVAIVKNSYEMYAEHDFVGIALEEGAGGVKGEVRMLIDKTDKADTFDVKFVTRRGYAEGLAVLKTDERGRAIFDTSEVKFQEKEVLVQHLDVAEDA